MLAARLDGCRSAHDLAAHGALLRSHIIASVTLAIPSMILAETALSFLGIGLKAGGSWGVLLKDAQSIRAVTTAPWLLAPGVAVIVAVLAFNFLGDGIRDAADPYGPPEAGDCRDGRRRCSRSAICRTHISTRRRPRAGGRRRHLRRAARRTRLPRRRDPAAARASLAGSILNLVPRAGASSAAGSLAGRDGEAIDIGALDAARPRDPRHPRQARSRMIFQEPMAALSPVHTIGEQIAE